jgi:hypothetical protein
MELLCLLDIPKDERALVYLTRRSARSPRSAWGTATTVITSAALRFVSSEDLQAEGCGACRSLRNQPRQARE